MTWRDFWFLTIGWWTSFAFNTWIRPLLPVFLLLLLPLTVWAVESNQLTVQEVTAGGVAEPPFVLNGWKPHCFEGGKEITCTTSPWTVRDMEWGYCLATMEAAMRAIEPYIVELDEKDQARFVLRNFPMIKPALKLWTEAKRCWMK